MAKMKEPRELVMHELGDILWAERTIVEQLPEMGELVHDEKPRARLEEHLEETRGQINNLEKAFKALGEDPEAEKCRGIEGLKAEHKAVVRETAEDLHDVVTAASAGKVEHYEIAAYSSLVTTARAMGEDKVADLLEENLEQEKAMLRDVERQARRLAQQQPQAA